MLKTTERPLINYQPRSVYDSKPRTSGAWVLGARGWTYTAKPEALRKKPQDQLKHPFFKTPDHMLIDDGV